MIPPKLQQLVKDKRLGPLVTALGPDAELHLVGGVVRDCLLDQDFLPVDLDLTTALSAQVVLEKLRKHNIHSVDVALQHSTVLAIPIEGEPGIEITSFRKLSPEGVVVEGERLEDDLVLRDFTLNSMAYSLKTGKIIDPLNAEQDLKAGLLRINGGREARFKEDPLRLLRMARFVASHGFTIEPSTFIAARNCQNLISKVSPERIRDELSKMLLGKYPKQGFLVLSRSGLLAQILPEIARMVAFEQNIYHRDDVFEHTLEVVEKSAPFLENRLAALLHDISKPETLTVDQSATIRHFYCHESIGAKKAEEILKRLCFPSSTRTSVSSAVKNHMRPLDAGKSGLRRLLRDLAEDYPLWRNLKEADATSCAIDPGEVLAQLKDFDHRIEEVLAEPQVHKFSSLAINGHHLIKIGFQPGPIIGEVLQSLHEQVLDKPELNESGILIKKARQYLELTKSVCSK